MKEKEKLSSANSSIRSVSDLARSTSLGTCMHACVSCVSCVR
jgi:hypothetical protein